MDQKQSPSLDPKLKEIYERVMNTPTKPLPSNPINPTKPPPVVPTPSLTTKPQEKTPPQFSQSETELNSSLFVADGHRNIQQPPIESQAGAKRKISPVIRAMGIIVFFAVYAIVWIKFFNLSLSFLPQIF